jgi:hypothetical protein
MKSLLIQCHSEGILFKPTTVAGNKKNSLACREPLAGQAYGMTVVLFSFLLWLFSQHAALAQTFMRSIDAIPIERNGARLEFPFFGGLDRFIPQLIDADGDGDVDLFISEADGQLTFLENAGSARTHKFRLNLDVFKNLNVSSWFYFVDIDADGDLDLYHDNGDNGLVFRRNLGSRTHPNFVIEAPTVMTNDNQKVVNQLTSTPTFADIDADGDLDFFTGIITGEIAMYQNIGTRAAPTFAFATGKWQDLLIFSFSAALGKKQLHGANAIEIADIDGDRDLDFFYGDLFHKGLYFLRNDGAPNNPSVAITDTLFPRAQPIKTFGYNVPRFADIDGDGDSDLFIASLQQNQNNFLFYKNSGTAIAPNFQLATPNFLAMLDAGSTSAPAFVDIDADGDQDLFVGNLDGQISFYENTGTVTAPAFRWVTDNLPNVQPTLHFSAAPAFADLDADGDFDLFVGSAFGRIIFYQNQGSLQSPNFIFITSAFANISAGSSCAPQFMDYDKDGDLDLFIGASLGGAVQLYENAGSVSQSRFQFKKIIRHAFNVDDAIPFLHDWTGDGILDLFIGERNGAILYYRAAADSFAFVQKDFANIDAGFYAAPAFVDINGDRRLDLFVGEGDGGVNFLQGTGSAAVMDPATPPNSFELKAHPNPFRAQLNISLRMTSKTAIAAPRLIIYNLTGARVAELEVRLAQNGTWRSEWLPAKSSLGSGVYFLQADWGRERINQKILFIH